MMSMACLIVPRRLSVCWKTVATSVHRRGFSNAPPWKVSKQQRTHLIFGANTDVGKTVVTAGLVNASLEHRPVQYIKPLQCGGSDQAFVERHVRDDESSSLSAETLFSWETPASPHMVCSLENKPVSDRQILSLLQQSLCEYRSNHDAMTAYIETAGGALSPSAASPENQSPRHAQTANGWGWIPQADLYQPLSGVAPVILVGDGRLGGISATLAALEVVVARGYDVAALVLLENGYDNASALRALAERKALPFRSGTGEPLFPVPLQSIVSLPPVPSDPKVPLFEWYDDTRQQLSQLEDYLQNIHEGQVDDWRSLPYEAADVLWWPNVQHQDLDARRVRIVNSASEHGYQSLASDDALDISYVQDASGAMALPAGHGESSFVLALAAGRGRYGSIHAPLSAHAPSVLLAQKLAADKVFYTKNPVEAALYMSFKTYHKRKEVEKPQDYVWAAIGQEGCYHGDTLGSMNLGEPRQTYIEDQHPWYESKSLLLPAPTWGYQDGVLQLFPPESYKLDAEFAFENAASVMDVTARLVSHRKLHSQYREMIEMQWLVYEHSGGNRKIAACVLEQLCVGLDCQLVDPLWQRALVDVAQSRGVPVVLDERQLGGCGRFGVQSCQELLHIKPDLVCFDDTIGVSLVLSTNEVFETFLGDEEGEALLHGYRDVVDAGACVGAIHRLDACRTMLDSQSVSTTLFDEKEVGRISQMDGVLSTASLGNMLRLSIQESESDEDDETFTRTREIAGRLRDHGFNIEHYRNVLCLMTTLPIVGSRDNASFLIEKLIEALQQ